MSEILKQVEQSVARWELEIEQHTLLHVAHAEMDLGNFPLERNLVDCLNRLRIMIDSMETKRAPLANIYLDVNLNYESFSLTQNKS